jgi:predicted dehydrogenase
MRVAILGSGFGLYCYLPAIMIGCRHQVVLPDRYRDRLRMRADVGRLSESVEWAGSDEAMLERADAVVISQRPADQVDRVRGCLRRSNIGSLILEKPLAPDPATALRLLEEIKRARKRFCIGYIFRYTEWGSALLTHARGTPGIIHISWHFRAHHYAVEARNWKRLVSSGGGAIRFFGIHLVALLAEMGYDRAVASCIGAEAVDEARTWRAIVAGAGLPDCHIDVDTNSDVKSFTVGDEHATLNFVRSDPLETVEDSNGFDYRVPTLMKLCRDFLESESPPSDFYRSSIELWRDIESKTAPGRDRLTPRVS